MKRKSLIQRILGDILTYLVASVSMAVVLYVLFALVFSTPQERLLQKENRLYRERFRSLQEKQQLIGDVVEGLLEKDDEIYKELFETSAPMPDALTAADVISDSDSLSESFYLSAAASASGKLMLMASQVDDNFSEIFRLLSERKDSIPPLTLPLREMSYVQTGASVGLKHNPVHKLATGHDGLDLVAPQGTPVYAAAGGYVSSVVRSRKGLGNMVTVNHGNGYISRYCLLGDISVSQGARVRRGQRIGTVGVSASVAAPHLHYEVLFNGEVQDPVNYLFASVSPESYSRMMYMSVSTAQSMD